MAEASVTGTWGKALLSNKMGNPNLEKLKEAEITATRLGFVKIDYADDEKPMSTYKLQFSKEQLKKTRDMELNNPYARYDRMEAANGALLKYTSEYAQTISAGTRNGIPTRAIDENCVVDREMLNTLRQTASTSRSSKQRLVYSPSSLVFLLSRFFLSSFVISLPCLLTLSISLFFPLSMYVYRKFLELPLFLFTYLPLSIYICLTVYLSLAASSIPFSSALLALNVLLYMSCCS